MLISRAVLFGGLIVGLTVSHAAASTISFAGSLIDLGSGWRTVSVSKDGLDLSGTGVLGVDGWYVPGAQGSSQTPSYVASVATNGNVYPGNIAYAAIDDPTTTPGFAPTTITSGTFNPFPGTGVTVTNLSFTIGAIAPALIRVGVMEDNLDDPGYNPSQVELTSSTGDTAIPGGLSGSAQNNAIPDWYFFDVRDASAGETFNVVNTGGNYGCGCLGAVSFDSAVPEPATWTLLIGAFSLTGAALRRRRLELAD